MKDNKIIRRLIPIMLSVMVGLTFSFAITKADASALSKPGQVKSLKVTHDTLVPDSPYLKWKKVRSATGYKVYRSTKKTKGYKCVATIKGRSNTKYADYGYDFSFDGKTWYYKVRAYKKKGSKTKYGKYSSVKSFSNPKIDVSLDPLKYGSKADYDIDFPYVAEFDWHFLVVNVSNNTSDDISLYHYINANFDNRYDLKACLSGTSWVAIPNEKDVVLAPNESKSLLFITDSEVEDPFEGNKDDYFDLNFTATQPFAGLYDFYGEWCDNVTIIDYNPMPE